MAIRYALHPNPISKSDYYRAIVHHRDPCGMDRIIEHMTAGGSTVTRAEALAVIEEYYAAMEYLLERGHRINTPFLNISFSVTGNFTGHDDQFDADRHRLRINTNPGRRLTGLPGRLSLQKALPSLHRPVLSVFRDVLTGSRNQAITPGGMGILHGSHLKLDTSDKRQGIFLMDGNGDELRIGQVVRNKPKELIFPIPGSLPAPAYTLEVRARLRQRTCIRSGRLHDELAPAPPPGGSAG